MQTKDLIAGLDPTGQVQITASELLQMVQEAEPETDRGFVFYAGSAPDTTTYPWIKRYIWLDTTTIPPTIKLWSTLANDWENLTFDDDTVTTDAIINLAVTAAKIAGGGAGTEGFFLRTVLTAGGASVEWVDLLASISNNSIAIAKLIRGSARQVLRTNAAGDGLEWTSIFDDIPSLIPDNGLSIQKLSNSGSPRYVLRLTVGGTVKEWIAPTGIFDDNELPITKLAPGTGNALKAVRVNVGGSALEFYTPSAAVSKYETDVTDYRAIPTVSGDTFSPFAHNLGVVPDVFQVRIVCIATDGSVGAVGDELRLTNLTYTGSNLNIVADATNIYIRPFTWATAAFKIFPSAYTGTVTAIDVTKWRIKAYAMAIP